LDLQYNHYRQSFTNANFDDADLSGANLYKTEFISSSIKFVDFHNAQLASVIIRNSDLKFSDLGGVNMPYAEITGSLIDFTNFDGANLMRAAFTDVEMFDSNFWGANLRYAKFIDTHFGGTLFFNSDLTGVEIINHTGERIGGNDCIADPNDPDLILQDTKCSPSEWQEYISISKIDLDEHAADTTLHPGTNTYIKSGNWIAIGSVTIVTADASCDAGDLVMGGGYKTAAGAFQRGSFLPTFFAGVEPPTLEPQENIPSSTSTWSTSAKTTDGDGLYRATALCLDLEPLRS